MGLSRHARVIHHLTAALIAAVLLSVGLAAVAVAAPARESSIGAAIRIGRAPAIPAGAQARGTVPS